MTIKVGQFLMRPHKDDLQSRSIIMRPHNDDLQSRSIIMSPHTDNLQRRSIIMRPHKHDKDDLKCTPVNIIETIYRSKPNI